MKFKLGKKPRRQDARTFKLVRYLAALPPVPSAIDWASKVPSWNMMLNDSIGDCTCATAGHMEMNWTANAGTEVIPSDAQILTAYEAVSGYNPANPSSDQGADVLTVLNYWRQTGIAGRKIFAYASIEPSSTQQIMAAVSLFGAAYIGVNLPQSAMDSTEEGQTWSNASDTNILGGHAIPIVAYDQNTLTCVTWGQLQTMTWAWFTAYCDEAYACFSPDWIGTKGIAPSGFNLSQLSTDLSDL